MEEIFQDQKIKVIKEGYDPVTKTKFADFCIEPVLKGLGITIGNSLRRTIISSSLGSAIIFLKIENVYSEFSYIEGVLENVLDIISNLKQVQIKVNSDELVRLYINTKGKGVVTAGDIQPHKEVEIFDPTCKIATITSDSASLKMELGVLKGRGFVFADYFKEDPTMPPAKDGLIYLNASFSPVKLVRFDVETSRYGYRTDCERINIHLRTKSVVEPYEVLSDAANMLKNQFNFLIGFHDRIKEEVKQKEVVETKKLIDLKKSIDELDLSVRAYNCLKKLNVETIEQLIQVSEDELKSLKNFGQKSLAEVKTKLSELGLSLKET